MAWNTLRILRLGPTDWVGLVRAYWYLLRAGWCIHIRKSRLDRWVKTSFLVQEGGTQAQNEEAAFDRNTWYVDVASRHPLRWARCLQRSLALCMWLEARGFRPILRIGVRKNGKELDAHAWVEENGRILNDGPMVEKEFARLRQFR